MGLYIDMEMPKDSNMIVIYSDGTARKYLSYTKVIIDEAKVISIHATDMRPVVHGHNTGNARIFECSECGYGFADIFLTNEHDYPIDPNFCPNCGARMEES